MAQLDGQYNARSSNLVLPKTLTSSAQKEVSIPRGSIWNFRERGAIIDIDPSNIIDSSGQDNFFLGTKLLTSPNTINAASSRCMGAANFNCSILGGTGDTILSSQNASMNNTGTGTTDKNAIIACFGGLFGSTAAGNQYFNLAGASTNPQIQTTNAGNVFVSGFLGSESCVYLNSNATNNLNRNAFLASLGNTISNLVGNTFEASINSTLSTRSSTISNSIGCSTVGCLAGTVNNSNYSLATGSAPNITGFTNVLAHSATATSSNQAIFGTRVDVTGGDLTISNGFINCPKGVALSTRAVTLSDTLLANDGVVLLNGTNIILTIPSAAAMGASFPLNTSRTWKVSSGPTFLGNANRVTLASGAFDNNGGLTTYMFTASGESIDLTLHNLSPTPFWYLGSTLALTGNFTAPANSFGVAPPKSDAAQLPTSTSEATHKALTTTSYVTFTAVDNSNYFQLSTGFPQVKCIMEGVVDYEVQVKTATGGGNYLIRADLALTATGVTIPNSYVEQGGVNTVPGTVVIRGKSARAYLDPFSGSPLTVRVSQDSTNLINASASILSVKLYITFRL